MVLNQNLALVGLQPVEAIDALNPPQGKPVSIIFMDAPYGQGLLSLALRAFQQTNWINKNTLVIVETDAKNPEPILEEFDVIKQRQAGRNLFLFLKCKE